MPKEHSYIIAQTNPGDRPVMLHDWNCDAYGECEDLTPPCALPAPHNHEHRCDCGRMN